MHSASNDLKFQALEVTAADEPEAVTGAAVLMLAASELILLA